MEKFKDRVDRVLMGNYQAHELVPVCLTPPLIEELGFSPLVMAITQKHIQSILAPESESADGRNTHELPRAFVNSLPERIAAPAMVLSSLTRPADSIVLVTEYADKRNRPIVITLMNEGFGQLNGSGTFCNIVTSSYGRNAFQEYLIRTVENGGLLYWDKKRSQDLAVSTGLQLPGVLTKSDSGTIIRRFDGNVNTMTENNTRKFKQYCSVNRAEIERKSAAATRIPLKDNGKGGGEK